MRKIVTHQEAVERTRQALTDAGIRFDQTAFDASLGRSVIEQIDARREAGEAITRQLEEIGISKLGAERTAWYAVRGMTLKEVGARVSPAAGPEAVRQNIIRTINKARTILNP